MADEGVMIRARASTRDALRELARADDASLIETLDRIVREAHEARILAATVTTLADGTAGDHVHAIAADARKLDETSADGLDPDEDFSDW